MPRDNRKTKAALKRELQREAMQHELQTEADKEHHYAMERHSDFLDAIKPVELPAELYAAWLGIYMEKDGPVRRSPGVSYKDSYWYLATNWPDGLAAPSGIGAELIKVMVLPAQMPAFDNRPRIGIEVGISSILAFRHYSTKYDYVQLQPVAYISHPPIMYPEIEDLLGQYSVDELLENSGIAVRDLASV